ncbi:unnamed protein product [Aspergillus oryzae]|uniref:Unnamed protein product n=2 Tax=Aspergillus oryzae TaxID=5062 RepID=A0AAN4YSK7_ASPOZ|nr:unnamed protein product [Aspergillus oryzae]GMF83280.1 unnamed protein product [Aspergillus oryzae]GMG02128.1 unnamed protein product [Aspergillus oryzae]GMG33302.1 unnamed protein product [Aspergillus oryzae]GMG41708.1 unnamed protein product [Aspergillus oryzae var. brunneus]
MQSYPGATFAVDSRQALQNRTTTAPFDLGVLAHTIRCPLGYVVHARSGDKGSDTNGGFFVRHADKWNWLRNLLSTDEIRELLGQDDTDKKIFRFELPNIWGEYQDVETKIQGEPGRLA